MLSYTHAVTIITYLKATKDLVVVFRRGVDLKLSLFADADYTDICNDSRSVSGVVVVMLGDTAVSATGTTQHCVILSTSEAEYVCMYVCMYVYMYVCMVITYYVWINRVSLPILLVVS